MKVNISLKQFLTQRTLGVFIILFIAYAFFVSFINLNAMDDTTEYYMHYEAQVLSEYYKKGDEILEFDKGIKEYYWGQGSLPKQYQEYLSQISFVENQLYLLETNTNFIYILPYQVAQISDAFFVVHLFDKKAHSSFENKITLQLCIFFLIALLAILYFIWLTNKKVSTQVSDLNEWVKSINIENINSTSLPASLYFEELIEIGAVLALSYQQQQALNVNKQALLKREQACLSTLSHELRTPISIISAACALLDKRNQLSDKDKQVLVKLSNANNNMKALTDTLLQLWRNQPVAEQFTELSILDLVNEIIQAEQLDTNLIELKQSNPGTIYAHHIQVSIVISNLLRNAFQYRARGKISITLDAYILTITNKYEEGTHLGNNASYGFGIGLNLVKTICSQNNWVIQTDTTDSIFNVKIQFKNQSII